MNSQNHRLCASCLIKFPNEILIEIFQNLPILDRVRFRLVCKSWSQLSLHGMTELMIQPLKYFDCARFTICSLNKIVMTIDWDWNRFVKVFHFFIQKVGTSLRRLSFGLRKNVEGNALDEQRLITTLITCCPNIVALHFTNCVPKWKLMTETLLKAYGNQLEEVFLNKHNPENHFKLLIQFLNPTKFHKLYYAYMSEGEFEIFCNAFPLLSELGNLPEYIKGMDVLKQMKHMKSVRICFLDSELERPEGWCVFIDKEMCAKLHFISFLIETSRHFSFLQNFTSLKTLELYFLFVIDEQDFQPIATQLPKLEELVLKRVETLESEQNVYHDFEGMVLFQHLRALYIKKHFLNPFAFAMQRLPPMPSVQTFELWNFKSDLSKKATKQLLTHLSRTFPNLQVVRFELYEPNILKLIMELEKLVHLRELTVNIRLESKNFTKAYTSNFKKLIAFHCITKDILLFIDFVKSP